MHSRATAASRCSRATSRVDGCIVKTAGVDESILKFSGPARVFESQDDAVGASSTTRSTPATSCSSATKARAAAPACRKCSIPTSYLKSKGLGKACALVTDGRFSGGSSGLSIGHVSPEAAEGGTIGLVERATSSRSTSPARSIRLAVERGGAGATARGAGPAGLEAGPSAAAESDPGAEGLCRLRHLRGAWCRARSRGAGVVSAQASHHQRIATTVAMPTAMSPALAKRTGRRSSAPPRLATMPALTTVLLRAARVMAVAATVTEFVRA